MSIQMVSFLVGIVLIVLAVVFFAVRRRKHGGDSIASEEQNFSKQLYVGNLDYRVREGELKRFFSQYGQIASVKVVTDNKTRRSKGFGFVTYATNDAAKDALQSNGKLFNGRGLVVRLAKPR